MTDKVDTYVWQFVGGPYDGLRREYPEPLDSIFVLPEIEDKLIEIVVPFAKPEKVEPPARYCRTAMAMSQYETLHFWRHENLTPGDAIMYLLKNYIGAEQQPGRKK